MDQVPCQEIRFPAGIEQELVVNRYRAPVRLDNETRHADERNMEVSDVDVLTGEGMYKFFLFFCMVYKIMT